MEPRYTRLYPKYRPYIRPLWQVSGTENYLNLDPNNTNIQIKRDNDSYAKICFKEEFTNNYVVACIIF